MEHYKFSVRGHYNDILIGALLTLKAKSKDGQPSLDKTTRSGRFAIKH